MKYSVRPMEERDIDAALFLERNTREAPHWSRADYEGCIAGNEGPGLKRAGFVAELQGSLLGFSIAKVVADVCELESLAVVEESRRQGIGIALMEATVNWARSVGAFKMELEVRSSNDRAVMFYERFGMLREGVRQRYYQAPDEDALLMGIFLVSGGKFP